MQVPKTLLIENGDIIKILPGNKPEIIDKAPSGKVYLDGNINVETDSQSCLLYTSPSPRDREKSRMPSSA